MPALTAIASPYDTEYGLSLDPLRSNGVDAVKLDSILAALDAYRDKHAPVLMGAQLRLGSFRFIELNDVMEASRRPKPLRLRKTIPLKTR